MVMPLPTAPPSWVREAGLGHVGPSVFTVTPYPRQVGRLEILIRARIREKGADKCAARERGSDVQATWLSPLHGARRGPARRDGAREAER